MSRYQQNFDSAGLSLKEQKINSLNFDPTTVVATSATTLINAKQLLKYDAFKVDQTSSANDIVELPSAAVLGQKVWLLAIGTFEVSGEGTDKINGTAAPNEVQMVDTELAEFTKVVDGWAMVKTVTVAPTTALTALTHTAPSTPDYAIQDLTSTSPFGFVTKDEGNTVLKVLVALNLRVAALEANARPVPN